jgi:hypothetical protein
VKTSRAPRTRKRIACELTVGDDRYRGIAIDVSASGIFVQTNVKLNPGTRVEIRLTLPGVAEPAVLEARVARIKRVPSQLLAVAGGGIGLAIERNTQAFLDFVADMSPEQADFMANHRGASGVGSAGARRSGGARGSGSGSAGPKDAAPGQKRFRIHAVDTKSGQKNTFLAVSESEEKASAKVVEELGEDWQVLFVERA